MNYPLYPLVGGFNPFEKYDNSSVGMMTFPIYGNIQNVPNHQSDHHHIPIVFGLYPINHY